MTTEEFMVSSWCLGTTKKQLDNLEFLPCSKYLISKTSRESSTSKDTCAVEARNNNRHFYVFTPDQKEPIAAAFVNQMSSTSCHVLFDCSPATCCNATSSSAATRARATDQNLSSSPIICSMAAGKLLSITRRSA